MEVILHRFDFVVDLRQEALTLDDFVQDWCLRAGALHIDKVAWRPVDFDNHDQRPESVLFAKHLANPVDKEAEAFSIANRRISPYVGLEDAYDRRLDIFRVVNCVFVASWHFIKVFSQVLEHLVRVWVQHVARLDRLAQSLIVLATVEAFYVRLADVCAQIPELSAKRIRYPLSHDIEESLSFHICQTLTILHHLGDTAGIFTLGHSVSVGPAAEVYMPRWLTFYTGGARCSRIRDMRDLGHLFLWFFLLSLSFLKVCF